MFRNHYILRNVSRYPGYPGYQLFATLQPPGPWRKKLNDNSITNREVKQMEKNLHSNQLDKLTRLKLGRTQIGMSAVHAGTSEDPWCKKCANRGQNEVENSILHCFYECPSTKALLEATILYFSPGSSYPEARHVILSTKTPVFNNLPKTDIGCQISSLLTDKVLYNLALSIDKQTLPSPQKLIQTISSELKAITKCRPKAKISRLLLLSPQLSHYTNYLANPPI